VADAAAGLAPSARRGTIRATPAMEAGVARSPLTVADLVDMAA
jgi:hypothetical protein